MSLIRKSLTRSARPGLQALVSCVLARECEATPDPQDVRETAIALEIRIAGMPAHLSLGMLGLTALFDASGFLKGRRASKMDPEACKALMNTWRNAPLGPARDFIVFYDKMAAFAFHSSQEQP
jgi:hypothetical protein